MGSGLGDTRGVQGLQRVTASLVLPVYEEAESLHDALTTIVNRLAERPGGVDWEVIVIDDGSSDGSADIAVAVADRSPVPVSVLRHRENHRLGGALRTAFPYTHGDAVVVLDADLTYSLDHLDRLVEAWLPTRPHVVVASPYADQGSAIAVPGFVGTRSRWANRILSRVGPEGVTTLTGMVRLYDGPFIRALPLKAVGPDVNVEILYKALALRARIVEIPAVLDWSGREHRTGRSGILSRSVRWTTLKSLLMSFLFKPYIAPTLLALFGATLTIVGAAFGGLNPHSIFTLGALIMVCSSFFAVSMLQSKRYFEETFTTLMTFADQRPMPPVTLLRGSATQGHAERLGDSGVQSHPESGLGA